MFFSKKKSNQNTNSNRILENKDKIYPLIKAMGNDSDSKNEVVFSKEDTPINEKWLSNLNVFYVIDQEEQVSFIQQKELPKDLSLDDIHKIAIQNLERDIEYRLNKLNFEGGYGLLAGGDFEASSITLSSLWESIANTLEDDLIVGIPSKDLVLIVCLSDTDAIISLAQSVNDIFEDGEHLLSKSLFRYSKKSGQWSLHRK